MIEKRRDMVLIELVESRAAWRERLGKWVAAKLGASVDAAHGGNSIRGYRHKCADVGERLADEGAREVTELGDAEVESLRAQVASLTEELAELPRVRPVEGGRPGEVDVFHDGHSHHFVPSSVLTHAQGRAEKAEKERDSLMADVARSTVGDNALDRLRLKQYAEFRKLAEDRQAVLRSELTAMTCAYEGAAREMVAARERAEKAERFAKMSEGDRLIDARKRAETAEYRVARLTEERGDALREVMRGRRHFAGKSPEMHDVLAALSANLDKANLKHGVPTPLPDGTGGYDGYAPTSLGEARAQKNRHKSEGGLTYQHIIDEEYWEARSEAAPERVDAARLKLATACLRAAAARKRAP